MHQRGQIKDSSVTSKCRDQLRAVRLAFLPPERDFFRFLPSLGVGLEFLMKPLTHETAQELTDYITKVPKIDSTVIEQLSDWYLTSSSQSDCQGNGFFWELLQQALLLFTKLQELEKNESSTSFDQFHVSCTNAMNYLYEMLDHYLSQLLTVSSFSSGNIHSEKCDHSFADSMCSHVALHHAIEFLLILARCLTEEDVECGIERRIFCKEPLIDLEKSDPEARACVISAGFQLIDIIRQRQMDCNESFSFVKEEYIELLMKEIQQIQRILMSPLNPHLKFPFLPGNITSPHEQLKYLEMLREADQVLLELILVHIQRLMCTWLNHEKTLTDLGEIVVWFDIVPPFLEISFPCQQELRISALNVLIVGLQVINSAASEDARKDILMQFEHSMIPILEAYLHHYLPQRTGKLPNKASDHSSQDIKVLDTVIQLLGEFYALCFIYGWKDWNFLVTYCLQPFKFPQFSEKANSLHRSFLSLFLTSALRVIFQHSSLEVDLGFCLYFWFRQMVDTQNTSTLKFYFSLILNQKIPLAEISQIMDLVESDSTGLATAGLIQTVLKNLLLQDTNSNLACFVTSRLPQWFIAREKELKNQELLIYLLKASAAIYHLLNISCKTNWDVRSGSNNNFPLLNLQNQQALIHLYFTWVFRSIVFLEESYIKNFRDVQAEKESPLVYFGEMMTCFLQSLGSYKLEENNPWMKTFQLLSTIFLEVPLVVLGPNSLDHRLFETLVLALDLHFSQQDTTLLIPSSPEQCLSETEQESRVVFLQFFLKNFFWNFVEKASNGSSTADKAVVNGLYLLKVLFSRSCFQDESFLLRILPCLLSPLARVLKSDSTRDLSPVCKSPVFTVLLELFKISHELLPEPPLQCNHLEVTGSVQLRGGPLQTGDPAGREQASKGLGVLLTLCLRTILSVLRYPLPEAVLLNADARQSSSTCFLPITKIDAARAQSSFTVLFGQYRKPTWIEQHTSIRHYDELEMPKSLRIAPSQYNGKNDPCLSEHCLLFLKSLAEVSKKTGKWIAPILHPIHCLLGTRCLLLSSLQTHFHDLEIRVKQSGIILVKTEKNERDVWQQDIF